jgi:hypothetical protein
MIVDYSIGGGLRLTEPNDFRNFKLLVKGAREDLPETEGIVFIDDHNALIAVSLVPTLYGCPDDKTWHAGYLAMVEAARKYGWIDAQANAIRAHIEYASE